MMECISFSPFFSSLCCFLVILWVQTLTASFLWCFVNECKRLDHERSENWSQLVFHVLISPVAVDWCDEWDLVSDKSLLRWTSCLPCYCSSTQALKIMWPVCIPESDWVTRTIQWSRWRTCFKIRWVVEFEMYQHIDPFLGAQPHKVGALGMRPCLRKQRVRSPFCSAQSNFGDK